MRPVSYLLMTACLAGCESRGTAPPAPTSTGARARPTAMALPRASATNPGTKPTAAPAATAVTEAELAGACGDGLVGLPFRGPALLRPAGDGHVRVVFNDGG